MPQKGRMTHILIQEGRSTHQLQDYVLFSELRAPGPCIVVRTEHIACRFGGTLGTLDAVLIRGWSLVTWRPLHHC